MSKHFISVLGTGLYEPVEYAFKGQSLEKCEFIQEALIRYYQKELQNHGKISIFLTEGARKRNWEDREYNEDDKKAAQKWKSDVKDMIIPKEKKQGLKKSLEQEFKNSIIVEDISIENASTESQIWSVFQTIYENIEEGDEIIFDITHSFRSIPMLAIIIINFARIMKNCKISGIYYGAYEAISDNGVAPVVDLTIYNDILQWTSATDIFMRYGNADQIDQLYKSKKIFLNKNKKDETQTKEWNQLGSVINSMKNLADALAACRGIDASKLENMKTNSSGRSIRCAYQEFKQKVQKEYPKSVKEIVPLHQLLHKAEENFSQFDKEQDFKIGCEVVRWSIQNNMTQQGYTALEETLKTYLCNMYDLDNRLEENRDKKIGAFLNAIAQLDQKTKGQITAENQYLPESRDLICKFVTEEDVYTRRLYINEKNTPEDLEKYNEIAYTLPVELALMAKKIKEKRNDINHFGFNKNPSSSDNLKTTLSKNFKEFEEFLQENSEQFKTRIKAYRSTVCS